MPDPGFSAIAAWRSLVRAKSQIGRSIYRPLREQGLSGAQLGILRVLAEAGGAGAKLNEVSQRLSVTSGNITGLIDRLEEAGYLARAPHPDDRRVTLAVLTQFGRDVFEKNYPAHLARVGDLMSALTVEEQTLLSGLLDRIADRASEMDR